jgi:hypothetical protein
MLVLADIDLSDCHLSRAYHVDALHIGGNCRFAEVPRGRISATGWPPIWRWSRRQTVAEEHAWRVVASHPIAWPTPSRTSNAPSDVLQPERIAVLYRQLRKALEDVKNEPGAADFYYGEMEMRRHATTISGGERFILWLYWLVSGYALRATRSLAFLVGVVAITTVLLASYGLPKSSLGAGVWPKTTRALLISLNSIIFRTAGQPLTTVGAFIELVARFTGPVLLALAIIALRNRIKR